MHHYFILFLATPEVSITGIDLTDEFVNITWELIQGHIESVSLGWMEYVEGSSRKKRSVVDGYIILESDIPPDETTIFVSHSFNISINNQFTLFAYEAVGMVPTGESPANQGLIQVNPPLPPPPPSTGESNLSTYNLIILQVISYTYINLQVLSLL